MAKIKQISSFQKIVLIIFSILLILQLAGHFLEFRWMVKNDKVFDLDYSYLLIPFLSSPLGVWGLYKISKFEKQGFIFFYISYSFTIFLELLRSLYHQSIFPVIWSIPILLFFYLTTRSIYKVSEK